MLVVGGWRFWDLEIGVALPLALGLTASSAGGSGAGRGVGELGVRTRECAVGVAKLGGVESVWWWTGGEANHFVLSRCAMQGRNLLLWKAAGAVSTNWRLSRGIRYYGKAGDSPHSKTDKTTSLPVVNND
jgi:hypothetical protein